MPSPPEAFLDYIHPHEVEAYRQRMISHLKGDSSQFMMEFRVRLPDGEPRWVLMRGVASRDEDLRAFRMAGSLGDINLRKRAEQQLMHDALHDGLTGLPNRAMFIEHANRALAQRRRGDLCELAVLAINLERFSLVNDSYGHAVGDELLRRVAAHISSFMRHGDVCARVGGDQFAVLLNGVDGSIEALRMCEDLVALPAFAPSSTERCCIRAAGWGSRSATTIARTRSPCCATPTTRCTRHAAARPRRSSSSMPRCTPRRCACCRSRPSCARRSRPAA